MTVLFKTVHGSHLYGTAHAESDLDYYVVVAPVKKNKKRYAKQSIVDGIDTTTLDLPTWLHYCDIGVPQALEAMFAPNPIIDELPALRHAYRTGWEARDRFHRTIESFIMETDFKKRRHGLRLAVELRNLLRYGRFNPVMDSLTAEWTALWATGLSDEQCLELAYQTAYM